MGKIYLTKSEKKELLKSGTIVIERKPCLTNTSKSSIIHGIGIKEFFNKIEYIWVYGDTDDYIEKMKNVGRRKTDYPDNKGNVWNGSKWFEFNRSIDDFGQLNDIQTNGRVHKIQFFIQDMFVKELRQNPKFKEYNQKIIEIKIKLV